jgi:hypothetical protein
MEDLYDDISDGACLATLISFYAPFDVELRSDILSCKIKCN